MFPRLFAHVWGSCGDQARSLGRFASSDENPALWIPLFSCIHTLLCAVAGGPQALGSWPILGLLRTPVVLEVG